MTFKRMNRVDRDGQTDRQALLTSKFLSLALPSSHIVQVATDGKRRKKEEDRGKGKKERKREKKPYTR